jgi:hypothetical protein
MEAVRFLRKFCDHAPDNMVSYVRKLQYKLNVVFTAEMNNEIHLYHGYKNFRHRTHNGFHGFANRSEAVVMPIWSPLLRGTNMIVLPHSSPSCGKGCIVAASHDVSLVRSYVGSITLNYGSFVLKMTGFESYRGQWYSCALNISHHHLSTRQLPKSSTWTDLLRN